MLGCGVHGCCVYRWLAGSDSCRRTVQIDLRHSDRFRQTDSRPVSCCDLYDAAVGFIDLHASPPLPRCSFCRRVWFEVRQLSPFVRWMVRLMLQLLLLLSASLMYSPCHVVRRLQSLPINRQCLHVLRMRPPVEPQQSPVTRIIIIIIIIVSLAIIVICLLNSSQMIVAN